MSEAPRLCLVVPAFNEAALLPRLLRTVEVARARYVHGPGGFEVIVADNGSTDATAGIALAHGCRVAKVEKRVIAAALSDPRIVGGATGITAERWSAGIAFCYYCLFLPSARITGVDAGLAFCRRRDWEAVGGYDESRRFAEDVDFLWRLRRLGRTRGQRLVRLRGVRAVYSTRKFDQHGDWHAVWQGARLVLGLLVHRPTAERIIEQYWYADRR